MSSLYELTAEFTKVQDMTYDNEISEEAIQTTLECMEYEIEEKAEQYAKIIKNIECDINGLTTEVKRLSAKKEVLERRKNLLKENLEVSMRITGKTKFKTDIFSFNIQKAGGLRPLIIDREVPKQFLIQQEPKVDNDGVRKFLKNNNVDWAHIGEAKEYLSIR